MEFAAPFWSPDSRNGLFSAEQITYIVRSDIKNIAGRRVLIIYFYPKDGVKKDYLKPRYTLFQGKHDYATLECDEDGKKKWRTSSLERLEGYYATEITKKSAFYRKSDEERASRFCCGGETGFDAICALQSKILKYRQMMRTQRREQKIIDRMKSVPASPRGMKAWVKKEILPAYMFYHYKKSKKPLRGYCTACGKDVLITDAKHCTKGSCPVCKHEVTFRALGRGTNIYDRATVQSLQKVGNGLLLRIYKVSASYHDYRNPSFQMWENARTFLCHNGNSVKSEPYYYSYSFGIRTHWRNGNRPIMFKYTYCFEADTCGHLYCKNMETALYKTPWQYCQIKAFYQADKEPMQVVHYLQTYLQYPMLEYLVKLRLYRLTADVVYRYDGRKAIYVEGKKLQEVLGVGMEDIPVLQKIDAGANLLTLYRELRDHNVRPDERLLLWCQAMDLGDAVDLLYCIQFVTAGRLMRYVDEQYQQLADVRNHYGAKRFERKIRVFSEYKDYLHFCTDLEYDLSDEFILFPRHLDEAHDRAAQHFDAHKTEILNKLIADSYEALLLQYQMKKYGLTILPPKSADEIVAEGHALHHCVGGYVSRVAAKECIILFLRHTANPEKSFYTIEVRNQKVAQVRGIQNCEPTTEVKQFMATWEGMVLHRTTLPAAA